MQHSLRINIIIFCFALAHALAVFFFRYVWDLNDDYILTILTIIMILTILKICRMPIDIGISLTLVMCIVGYFLGTKGAQIIALSNTWIADHPNIIMAFIATEILGLFTYLIAYKKAKHTGNNIS